MTAEQTSPGVKVREVDDIDLKDRKCDLDTSVSGDKSEVEESNEVVYDEMKETDKVNGFHEDNMDIDTDFKRFVKKEKEETSSSPETVEKNETKDKDELNKSDKKVNSVTLKKEMTDADIEKTVKKELREAVEIRIPKIRSKRESDDTKWASPNSTEKSHKSSKRAETPPLQKLMRHEFSPLKSDSNSMHYSAKRFKDSSYSSTKEGFTSKLASVIIPSSNIGVSPKTASHPKQLLSHSLANLRSSSLSSKLPFSASSLLSRSYPISQPVFQNHSSSSSSDNDQPLDLSKKAGKHSGTESSKERSSSSTRRNSDSKKHDNGMSSTSLQSLQQKFGGDFHLRGLRKPLNYMLYGPEIPALHQALLHTASMALPHFPFPFTNGLPKYTPEKIRHRNSTPSPSGKSKPEESSKPIKKEEAFVSEKPTKRESVDKIEIENCGGDEKGENYTNHLCTCGKWYDGLYSLSLHLQETGHLPARNKSVNLMEYPKLVRGQDMWLNQESEQTRRILRCIQCGESFKTLPLLTVHMMKTQHYTKIVSSEHTRRTHKCSAYCDKEQDKDCVFKCKVCQETFTDMEGLANHMIMSGHHKKQSPRASQGFSENSASIHFKKRKRYSFEDTPNPFGNPTIAAMLELKRQTGQLSPDLPSDDLDDSRITCENCGNKIETRIFVEHVRACLGQKLREDVAKLEKEKENLKKLERERKRLLSLTEKEKAAIEQLRSPSKKVKLEKQTSEDEIEEDRNSSESMFSLGEKSVKLEADVNENEEDKTSVKIDRTRSSDFDSVYNETKKFKPKLDDTDEELEAGEITDKSKNILKEIQTLVESKSSSFDIKRETSKSEDAGSEESKRNRNMVAKKLEIIDPDNVKEESSNGGSALSAMESFIKKSFSNKFDYKKGNIVISPHTSADATVHTAALGASSMGFESMDYLNRYKNFYAALNLHNGSGKTESVKDKNKRRDTQEHLKNGMKSGKDSKARSGGGKDNSDDEKEDGRGSVKSESSDTSGFLEKDANLETKYLNTEEGEESPKEKGGKSSALDNLSSFVYGQTMTSEHPLDSLQKLITKSDIPKLMASEGAARFKYLPPHLQMHHANLDLSVPMNLTVKSPIPESDEEEDSNSRIDENSLSDYETMNSPANSDGEPVEYRCTACSRRFASKGSYRYHLSRCHLSSVKKYGIKEAFNMSPYVYLPLDHTAKFSKYYEMAKELANKSKEARAKSN